MAKRSQKLTVYEVRQQQKADEMAYQAFRNYRKKREKAMAIEDAKNEKKRKSKKRQHYLELLKVTTSLQNKK